MQQRSPFNIVIDGAPDKNGVFRIYEIQPANHSGSTGQIAVFGEDLLVDRTFPFLKEKYGPLWHVSGCDQMILLRANFARQAKAATELPNVRWASFQGYLMSMGIGKNSTVSDLRHRYPKLMMPSQTGLVRDALFNKAVFAALLPDSLKPHMPDFEILPSMTLSPLRKALIERFGTDKDIVIKGAQDVMGQSVGLIDKQTLNSTVPHPNETSGVNLSKLYNFLGARRPDNRRVLRHVLSNGLLQSHVGNAAVVAQECVDPMLFKAKDGFDYKATMRLHCTVWWDEHGQGQVEYQGAYWKLPPEPAQEFSTDMSVMSPRQKYRPVDQQFAAVDPALESEIFMQMEAPLIRAMEDFDAMNQNPESAIKKLMTHPNRGHRITGLGLSSIWHEFAWTNTESFPQGLAVEIIKAAEHDPVINYLCRVIPKNKGSHRAFAQEVTNHLNGNRIDSFQAAYHLTT